MASSVPALSPLGRLQLDLNLSILIRHALLAVWHSLIIMILPVVAYPSFDDGSNNGLSLFGHMIYSCLVFAMWYRGLFISWTINRWVGYGLAIGVFLWFLFAVLQGEVGA